MFNDPRLARLFDLLAKGEPKAIVPTFAPRSESLCRYPWAESVLNMSIRHANRVLEDLTRGGYLKRQFYNKVIFCPSCNSQDLHFITLCPKCRSGHIISARVIEHSTCGMLATEEEFRNGIGFSCPKCHRELRLLGSDYQMPGIYFKCHACGELTQRPLEKWRCEKCHEEMERDEVREFCLYSYELSEVPTEHDLVGPIPRSQIEDFLIHEGYDIQSNVKVTGRSGAVHDIDLLATKTSGTLEHRLVVGFASHDTEIDSEEVIKLYAKAYDVSAQDIVMVAIPRLSEDAVQFASHYRIRVLDAEDLGRLHEKLLV
jgi:hypothetical protein